MFMAMGLTLLRSSLFFLLICGSLLSTSSAGGPSKFFSNLAADVDAIQVEGTPAKPLTKEGVTIVHERLLRANTRDYGRYDPSPTFSKPRHKLIPNGINA